jgi:cell division protein FtsQ
MARATNVHHQLAGPVSLPADVRLMNAVATTVFVLTALGVAASSVLWLMRSPMFPIRVVLLDGDLARNSLPTIRANAAPRLAGNFFSVDLQQAQRAFESVPWVRRAIVRRVWPDRLAVSLEEHRAAALWLGSVDGKGEDGKPVAERLVNSHGEVFEANVGDVEDDNLPSFSGPEGSAGPMLALHRRLEPTLSRAEMDITSLQLTQRGSWRVELDSGAAVEMGRGSEDEVLAKVERFVRTIAQVTGPQGRWQEPLEYADLRHADGYAVRLRGVTTTTKPTTMKQKN